MSVHVRDHQRVVMGLPVVIMVLVSLVSAAQSSASESARESVQHQIDIRDFVFEPSVVTVRPGDSITWVNRDIVPHTATALDASWDSGKLETGEQFTLMITADLSLAYFCEYHPMMVGELEWADP